MPDKILMEGMYFHNHTGVNEPEKQYGQVFIVDVELELFEMKATESDLLADTISYSAAYDVIRQIFATEAYDLVERLCGVIAGSLFSAFELLYGVTVTVRKPNAPITGTFSSMGAQIHRTRQKND
ncbi:MAG: dihydroneopterin aldolase [Ruminococcaceae bacterium]|nr:dihydroneopterin aldolase [Oscillospiraceae bacterium]